MRISLLFVLLGSALLSQTPPAAQPVKPPPGLPAGAVKPPATATKPADTREPGLYGAMETSMGTLKFVLFEKAAPITVKNFVDLCLGRKQWFDEKAKGMVRRPLIPGTTFHRVIPGFMIQGGDPTGTGAGDVGFKFGDEFHPDYKFDRPGRFGMANAGPSTNSSQFFITEVPTPHLDGKHTVFGQVTDNLDLVNQIARVPKNADNKPNTAVRIVRVTFERVGPVPPNAPEGAPAIKKSVAPVKKAAAPGTAPATTPPAKKAAPPVTPPAKK